MKCLLYVSSLWELEGFLIYNCLKAWCTAAVIPFFTYQLSYVVNLLLPETVPWWWTIQMIGCSLFFVDLKLFFISMVRWISVLIIPWYTCTRRLLWKSWWCYRASFIYKCITFIYLTLNLNAISAWFRPIRSWLVVGKDDCWLTIYAFIPSEYQFLYIWHSCISIWFIQQLRATVSTYIFRVVSSKGHL